MSRFALVALFLLAGACTSSGGTEPKDPPPPPPPPQDPIDGPVDASHPMDSLVIKPGMAN
jgi:hypothetical protein